MMQDLYTLQNLQVMWHAWIWYVIQTLENHKKLQPKCQKMPTTCLIKQYSKPASRTWYNEEIWGFTSQVQYRQLLWWLDANLTNMYMLDIMKIPIHPGGNSTVILRALEYYSKSYNLITFGQTTTSQKCCHL